MTYDLDRSADRPTEPGNAHTMMGIPGTGNPYTVSWANLKSWLASTFTPTKSNIYAAVKAILQAGTNVQINPNDGQSELTFSASGTGGGGGTTVTVSTSTPTGGANGDLWFRIDEDQGELSDITSIYVRAAGSWAEVTELVPASQQNIYTELKNILQAGDNITLTEDDTDDELTIASTGGGGTSGGVGVLQLTKVGATISINSASVTGPALTDLVDTVWFHLEYDRSPDTDLNMSGIVRKADLDGYLFQFQGAGSAHMTLSVTNGVLMFSNADAGAVTNIELEIYNVHAPMGPKGDPGEDGTGGGGFTWIKPSAADSYTGGSIPTEEVWTAASVGTRMIAAILAVTGMSEGDRLLTYHQSGTQVVPRLYVYDGEKWYRHQERAMAAGVYTGTVRSSSAEENIQPGDITWGDIDQYFDPTEVRRSAGGFPHNYPLALANGLLSLRILLTGLSFGGGAQGDHILIEVAAGLDATPTDATVPMHLRLVDAVAGDIDGITPVAEVPLDAQIRWFDLELTRDIRDGAGVYIQVEIGTSVAPATQVSISVRRVTRIAGGDEGAIAIVRIVDEANGLPPDPLPTDGAEDGTALFWDDGAAVWRIPFDRYVRTLTAPPGADNANVAAWLGWLYANVLETVTGWAGTTRSATSNSYVLQLLHADGTHSALSLHLADAGRSGIMSKEQFQKLAAIEAGAEVNPTGAEIVALIEALAGNDRLNYDRLRNLPIPFNPRGNWVNGHSYRRGDTVRRFTELGYTVVAYCEQDHTASSANWPVEDSTAEWSIIIASPQSDWESTNASAPEYIKNKPEIPPAPLNADWDATEGLAEILNKPNLADYQGDQTYLDAWIREFSPGVPKTYHPNDWVHHTDGDGWYIVAACYTTHQASNANAPEHAQTHGVWHNVAEVPPIDWDADSGHSHIRNKPEILSAGQVDNRIQPPARAGVNDVWPVAKLGTGDPTAEDVLHGDGRWDVPAGNRYRRVAATVFVVGRPTRSWQFPTQQDLTTNLLIQPGNATQIALADELLGNQAESLIWTPISSLGTVSAVGATTHVNGSMGRVAYIDWSGSAPVLTYILMGVWHGPNREIMFVPNTTNNQFVMFFQ